MLKIAVCDDDREQMLQIQSYLKDISRELNIPFKSYYFSSGEELLSDMPRDIQVLLLDIQMGQLSGLDAARELRKAGLDFYLFFITGNIEYALEGYEVHAYAFLRKPLVYSHLKRYLSEVCRKIEDRKPKVIRLKQADGTFVIPSKDILYAEVYGHDVQLVTATQKIQCTVSLSELEQKLEKYHFFRCHRSYLVNLTRITLLRNNDLEMPNGDRVPVSKYRRRELTAAFAEVMGELL